jgi:hypothetical protein
LSNGIPVVLVWAGVLQGHKTKTPRLSPPPPGRFRFALNSRILSKYRREVLISFEESHRTMVFIDQAQADILPFPGEDRRSNLKKHRESSETSITTGDLSREVSKGRDTWRKERAKSTVRRRGFFGLFQKSMSSRINVHNQHEDVPSIADFYPAPQLSPTTDLQFARNCTSVLSMNSARNGATQSRISLQDDPKRPVSQRRDIRNRATRPTSTRRQAGRWVPPTELVLSPTTFEDPQDDTALVNAIDQMLGGGKTVESVDREEIDLSSKNMLGMSPVTTKKDFILSAPLQIPEDAPPLAIPTRNDGATPSKTSFRGEHQVPIPKAETTSPVAVSKTPVAVSKTPGVASKGLFIQLEHSRNRDFPSIRFPKAETTSPVAASKTKLVIQLEHSRNREIPAIISTYDPPTPKYRPTRSPTSPRKMGLDLSKMNGEEMRDMVLKGSNKKIKMQQNTKQQKRDSDFPREISCNSRLSDSGEQRIRVQQQAQKTQRLLLEFGSTRDLQWKEDLARLEEEVAKLRIEVSSPRRTIFQHSRHSGDSGSVSSLEEDSDSFYKETFPNARK